MRHGVWVASYGAPCIAFGDWCQKNKTSTCFFSIDCRWVGSAMVFGGVKTPDRTTWSTWYLARVYKTQQQDSCTSKYPTTSRLDFIFLSSRLVLSPPPPPSLALPLNLLLSRCTHTILPSVPSSWWKQQQQRQRQRPTTTMFNATGVLLPASSRRGSAVTRHRRPRRQDAPPHRWARRP